MEFERFKTAQNSAQTGFAAALDEIRGGRKRGHWIWYIFPQLSGLGTSGLSQTFAIGDEAEAAEYLQDSELRSRLLTITAAVAAQLRSGVSLRALMGSDIDALKVISSLTLFRHVAGKMYKTRQIDACRSLAAAATDVLLKAEAEGYPPCAYTLRRLQEME